MLSQTLIWKGTSNRMAWGRDMPGFLGKHQGSPCSWITVSKESCRDEVREVCWMIWAKQWYGYFLDVIRSQILVKNNSIYWLNVRYERKRSRRWWQYFWPGHLKKSCHLLNWWRLRVAGWEALTIRSSGFDMLCLKYQVTLMSYFLAHFQDADVPACETFLNLPILFLTILVVILIYSTSINSFYLTYCYLTINREQRAWGGAYFYFVFIFSHSS